MAGYDTPIGLGRPADLKSLFEKRFDDACVAKRIGDDANESASWNAARNVFEYVYDKVARERANFLVNLCNYNVRRALNQFENILLNKRYFEPDGGPQLHPEIKESSLNFTESAALRALGMGDGVAFPNSETELSNIFLNQMEPTADLLGLFIVLAIYYRGENLEYGLRYSVKKDLLLEMETVCCLTKEQIACLPWVMEELESHGLIVQVTTKRNDEDKEVEYVELLPKAATVWKALTNSSVLTEMFRDDTYVLYTSDEASSLRGTQDLPNDLVRIEAALNFGKKLIAAEQNFVEKCLKKHGGVRWTSTFGPLTVGRAILKGIGESCKFLGIRVENLNDYKDFVLLVEHIDKSLGRL